MHLWRIYAGKRTLKVSIIGLILGAIIFFNSDSITLLVRNTLLLTTSFALLTIVTETFDSWTKIIIVWTLLIAVPIGGFFMTSSSICNLMAVPEYDIARNPLTGEIEQRNNPSTCDTVSFPWYYQDLNKSETVNHCKENPKKAYCVRNVDSVKPNLENLSQRQQLKFLR